MTSLPIFILRFLLGFWHSPPVRHGRAIVRCLLRRFAKAVHLLACLLLLGWWLGLLLIGGLRYIVLPHIDDYRPQLEQKLSTQLERPVTLQTVTANWAGLQPQLTVENLVIYDPQQGTAALTIPKISAVISWQSLLVLDLRLASLTIEQAELNIRRTAEKQLLVAGFMIDLDAPSDGTALAWLLQQGEIHLRNSHVRWEDALANARTGNVPPLELSALQARLRNRGSLHEVALQATLPPGLGGQLDVRSRFQHAWWRSPAVTDGWYGQVYWASQTLDLQKIRAYLPLPKNWYSGHGQTRFWLDFVAQAAAQKKLGRLNGLTAEVSLEKVHGQLSQQLPELNLETLNGRFEWQKTAHGMRFSTENLWLKGIDGLSLPPVNLRYEETSPWLTRLLSAPPLHSSADDTAQAIERQLRIDQINLTTLNALLARLPLDSKLRDRLNQYQLKGELTQLNLRIQGPILPLEKNPAPTTVQATEQQSTNHYSLPKKFQLQAQFKDLSWLGQVNPRSTDQHPLIGWPGLTKASGTIRANEHGGELSLHSQDGILDLPGVWREQTLPLQNLKLHAKWQPSTQHPWAKGQADAEPLWEVVLDELAIRNPDFGGQARVRYIQGPQQQDWLDLEANLNQFNLSRISRYLPLRLPAATRAWSEQALPRGNLRTARFQVRGDLQNFPFDHATHPDELFKIDAELENGKLVFAPDWPALENLKGKISFEGPRFSAKIQQGQTLGLALQPTDLRIADTAHSELIIDGGLQGNANSMLHYVRSSALNEWLGKILNQASATQEAYLKLKLNLPFAQLDKSKVQGSLQLRGGQFSLEPDLPSFERINGGIDFTEQGFTLRNFSCQYLGGSMRLEGGMRPTAANLSSIQFKAEGSITPAGIQAYYPLSLLDRLSGNTNYSATVTIQQGIPTVRVESSLQGIKSSLPTPFDKEAQTAWPLKIETLAPQSASKSAGLTPILKDEIRVSLSNLLQLRIERVRHATSNAKLAETLKIERVALGINTSAEFPANGMGVKIQLPQLNLDAWRLLLTPNPQPTNALVAPPGAHSDDHSNQYLPTLTQLQINSKELEIFGRKFSEVEFNAKRQGNSWEANLDAPGAAGFFVWRDEIGAGRGARLVGRMSKLSIPQGELEALSSSVGHTVETLPALDLAIEDFQINQKLLGQLELVATNHTQTGKPAWHLDKLKLQNPEAVLQGNGVWQPGIGKDGGQTNLHFTLDSKDWGGLLDRLGYPNIIRGSSGQLAGDLQWRGAPTAFDPASLNGTLDLAAEQGQFLKADPKAGKLLGVLSLQALPRRLTLDFRDVFSEGFMFDSVSAHATLKNGIMRTENFKMKSPAAVVALEGQADLAKETQDLHVVVIPDTRPGLATLAGVVANPVIGVGAFLGQLLFRDPIAKAFTYEYSITGTWSDPQITELKGNAKKSNKTDAPTNSNNPNPAKAPTVKP